MRQKKTHFEQIPVKVVKKIAMEHSDDSHTELESDSPIVVEASKPKRAIVIMLPIRS